MKKTKAPYRIRASFDMVNRYAYGAGLRVGLEHADCVSVRAKLKACSLGGAPEGFGALFFLISSSMIIIRASLDFEVLLANER